MLCKNCDKSTSDTGASFCSGCGTPYTEEEKFLYIGTQATRGIYRVTFPPQEGEFDHEDHVNDAIRHSAWNEDREFEGEPKVEFVRSTVTPETHPYECGVCKADDSGENIVSVTNEGRCENCGEVNWLRRDV